MTSAEFKYGSRTRRAPTPTLEFRGDDDVWVFINNRLAVAGRGHRGRQREGPSERAGDCASRRSRFTTSAAFTAR